MFSPLLQPLLQPLMRGPMEPSGRTLIQRATAVLRRYGQDAHIYLPGVGMLNGLQAGNYLDSALTTPATIDNPVGGVVDAMGGINATQPTTASKPILRRGAVAINKASQDFASWLSTAAGSLTTGQSDPYGGSGATLFSGAGSNLYQAGTSIASPVTTGTPVTQAIQCYSPIAGTIKIGSANGTIQTVSIDAGWGLYVINFAAVGTGDGPAIALSGTLASITIFRVALFQGTYTAQQIQALGGIPLTTTAPASTALGPQYWQFDGSNDSLSLGGPLFQQVDDHFVCAAFSTLATNSIFSGAGRAAEPYPEVAGLVNSGGFVIAKWRDDANFTVAEQSATPGGQVAVASLGKDGETRSLWLNGVLAGSSASTLGVTTVTNAAIGSYATGGSFCAGGVYQIIALKGAPSAAEKVLLTKLVGQLSGVQI